MSKLCPSCVEAYEKWIDYRFTGPLGRWRTDSPNGKNTDLYWQRSVDAWRQARQERNDLVRWQCDLIKRICAKKHSGEVTV